MLIIYTRVYHNLIAACKLNLLSFIDMPMERKTPTAYPDGSYQIVQESTRGNVMLISNITQNGLTGLGSQKRTAFFTFFGKLKS